MYFDGQFDDARLNVTLACTAAAAGATVVNYVEASDLLKVRSMLLPTAVSGCASALVAGRTLPSGLVLVL